MGWLILLIIAAVILWMLINKKEKTPIYVSIEETKTIEVPYIFKPTPENLLFIRALIFIGKADGQLRENEILIINDYLRNKQPEHQTNPDNYAVEKIRELKPFKSSEYKTYINALTSDQINDFIVWTRKIIGTQKTIHPFEEYLLDDLIDIQSKYLNSV